MAGVAKRGGGGRGGVLSGAAAQIVIMFTFAAVIFLAGITVGSQLFDHRGTGAAVERPWATHTKQQLPIPNDLPPGIRAARVGGAPVAPAPVVEDEEPEEEEEEEEEEPAAAPAAVAEPAPIAAAAAAAPVNAQPAAAAVDVDAALARITAAAKAGPVEFWGDFSGRAALQLDGSLDSPLVSFGAWIYLDSRDRGANIKTIASNRNGGCAVDNAHRGWSFFVNNWESGDRALVLEWRNSKGSGEGCLRLSSERDTIPYDTWVHVGFALAALDSPAAAAAGTNGKGVPGALLFLNGDLLKSSQSIGRSAGDVQAPGVDGSDDGVRLHLGSTADGQYYFNGRIANVFVSPTIVSPKQLAAAALAGSYDEAVAFAGRAPADKLAMFLLLATKAMPKPPKGEDADEDAAEGKPKRLSLKAIITSSGMFLLDAARRHRTYGSTSASSAAAGLRGAAAVPLGATALSPPLARGHELAYKDGLVADKVPRGIRRGSVPGTLPSTALADFTKGGNQWVKHMIHTPKEHATGPVTDTRALAAGTFSDEVTAEEMAASDELGRERAAAVKAAMQHAWRGYKDHAWGADELRPRSGAPQDNWGGLGMTLVDSLDTLWLMGMMDEFEAAKEWVRQRLNFDKHASVSVFETTIRALGGLLAAYDLSGDAIFLEKAKQLADKLLPAFNTPSGVPRASVVLATGSAAAPGWTGGASILSELGTLQVEFRYLSAATGEPHYGRKAEAVIERMDAIKPAYGLYPIYISADSGAPTSSQVTFGALGDSFYEYLIKVWVQGGRSEPMYRRMYDASMAGMTEKLLKRTRPSNLAYVADYDGSNTQDKMDHLVCFVPGMLALGAFTSGGTPGEANALRDLNNAKALAYTCWQLYERTSTGISPEFVEFPGGRDPEVPGRAPFYILRPEAAESLFILHQLTGNPIYREWGWRMFQNIDKYCKVAHGYGAHPDVRDPSRTPDDRMESFFLAETLKYLYLLQSPDHPISLERYVFNTEAHPLRNFRELAK